MLVKRTDPNPRGVSAMQIHSLKTLALAALLSAASSSVHAAGLDRDTLLTEAPAVPNPGTVRLTGGANGQPSGAADSGSTGGVSGNIRWAPIDRIAGDVGLYVQGPDT